MAEARLNTALTRSALVGSFKLMFAVLDEPEIWYAVSYAMTLSGRPWMKTRGGMFTSSAEDHFKTQPIADDFAALRLDHHGSGGSWIAGGPVYALEGDNDWSYFIQITQDNVGFKRLEGITLYTRDVWDVEDATLTFNRLDAIYGVDLLGLRRSLRVRPEVFLGWVWGWGRYLEDGATDNERLRTSGWSYGAMANVHVRRGPVVVHIGTGVEKPHYDLRFKDRPNEPDLGVRDLTESWAGRAWIGIGGIPRGELR